MTKKLGAPRSPAATGRASTPPAIPVTRGLDLFMNELAVFVRVVERGGFARAADELGVRTSSVSRAVARLEAVVGARLLQRTSRSVQATTEGSQLYDSVARSVTAIRRAGQGLAPVSGAPRGRLRITAPVDIAQTFLAGVVAAFVERYPLVEVEMSATNRLVNLVEEGFDLAVRASRLADSSLIARRIGDGVLTLYASPHYLDTHGVPSAAADLERHRVVVFGAKGGDAQWRLRSRTSEATIRVHGHVGGDDYGFLRAIVLASSGIGLLPEIICAEDEAAGRIVRVLPGFETFGAPIHVLYPSARHVPTRVTAFRDLLVESFAERIAGCRATARAQTRARS